MPSQSLMFFFAALLFASPTYAEICQDSSANIYTIDANLQGGFKVRLTGFAMVGMNGILTSLHGVAGATLINATPGDPNGRVLTDMNIAFVDIPNDVALLRPSKATDHVPAGFPASSRNVESRESLVECGHPDGNSMHRRDFQANAIPYQLLESFTATDAKQFRDRGSPAVGITVVALDASMIPGESGAPIIDSAGNIKGIEEGGLDRGAANISWAIPIGNLHFTSSSAAALDLATLLAHGPSTALFAFESRSGLTPHEIVVSIDGDGQFRSIIDALRHAKHGDTIIVRPGTYSVEQSSRGDCYSEIDASRLYSVSIEGSGSREDTIISGCISITKNNTSKLRNFTLKGTIFNFGTLEMTALRVNGQSPLKLQEGSLTSIDRTEIDSELAQHGHAIEAFANTTLHVTNSRLISDDSDIDMGSGSTLTFDHCVFSAERYLIEGYGGSTRVTNSDLRKVDGVTDRYNPNRIRLANVSHGTVSIDKTNKIE